MKVSQFLLTYFTLITALEASPEEELIKSKLIGESSRRIENIEPIKNSVRAFKTNKRFHKTGYKKEEKYCLHCLMKTIPPENVDILKTNQIIFRIVKTLNKITRNIFPTILKTRKTQIKNKALLTLNKNVSQRTQNKIKYTCL